MRKYSIWFSRRRVWDGSLRREEDSKWIEDSKRMEAPVWKIRSGAVEIEEEGYE